MALESPDVLLSKMAEQLKTRINNQHIDNPAMIGIHTGGVWVARHLHQQLGIEEPLGTLDISFYRDDFSRIGMSPQVKPSQLPFSIDDRNIILVDDVLYTGRTIRAALNELFDYGRPASITLAVLIVRSGREIPISADVAGTELVLEKHQQIKLYVPAGCKETDALSLEIVEVTNN
ncbi:MAG: bifunctional pyr operon transcriptional regulator/uracil phosphoribosyltransferase PyrR [Thiotrichales bacterium]|nr:bifunctional pyr operon transcriptional regulator/uracil phosphoribosyltransferase PyrR [Thiotrichales bacterium]